MDGIHFRERIVLLALGIDSEGGKHVLGLREGSTENATVVRALLSDLVEHGLDPERSRLCGVVTVSARNHDVDLFIENGVNGFYSNDAAELRDFLLFLMRHPEEARRIGAAGRRTAMDLFNYDRYLGDWLRLVDDLVGRSERRMLEKLIPTMANE